MTTTKKVIVPAEEDSFLNNLKQKINENTDLILYSAIALAVFIALLIVVVYVIKNRKKDVFEEENIQLSKEQINKPMGLEKKLHIKKLLEMPEVKKSWEIE